MSSKSIEFNIDYKLSEKLWLVEFSGQTKLFIDLYNESLQNKFALVKKMSPENQRLFNTGIFYSSDNFVAIFGKNTETANLKKCLSLIANSRIEAKKVYLIGKNWLKLDIDLMLKQDLEVNLIYFEQKIFKVFTSQKKFQIALKQNLLPDNSLLWKLLLL